METSPFQRAFLVQFVESDGKSPARFVGRVEHLDSGRKARFASRKTLLDVLAVMLHEASPQPSAEEEAAPAKPPTKRPGKRKR